MLPLGTASHGVISMTVLRDRHHFADVETEAPKDLVTDRQIASNWWKWHFSWDVPEPESWGPFHSCTLNFQERISVAASSFPAIQGGRHFTEQLLPSRMTIQEDPLYSLSGLQGWSVRLRWCILDAGDLCPPAQSFPNRVKANSTQFLWVGSESYIQGNLILVELKSQSKVALFTFREGIFVSYC